MNRRSARLGPSELSAVLVAIMVVVAGTAFDFSAFTAPATSTASQTAKASSFSTSLANGTVIYASPVSEQGLRLRIVLNSTSFLHGGTIGARLELLTTEANTTMPVPGFSMNEPVEVWNGYDYVCGGNPSNSVLAFAVFPGHYSSANISSAGQPLYVGAQFFPPCPNGGYYPSGHSISFSSTGVNAELNVTNGYCAPNPGLQNGDCGALHALMGFWNRTATGDGSLSSRAFVRFPAGEYTIGATDLWNQYVYATFSVEPENASTPARPFVVMPGASAYSLNQSTGLRLHLNLSTNAQGEVVVTVYERNTLDRVNNVSYGNSWPDASLFRWATTNCENGGMEGYEVLRGNYQYNNFTDGKALWLQPQANISSCGESIPGNDSYSFKPLGAEGLLSGTYTGFWTTPEDASTYQRFPPGVYTVVAGDQWGNTLMMQFTVAD